MSGLFETVRQSFPGKPTFTEKNIPDLTDKVIIVTGANTGVGKELAEILYSKNAKVYMMARSEEKTQQAMDSIKAEVPHSKGDMTFIRLDLADISTIKDSVDAFLEKENKLHVLINNAGVAFPASGSYTQQGYDLQLGVNCLGPFALTKLLTPTLAATAKEAPPSTVRVVWTASSAAYNSNVPAFLDNVNKADKLSNSNQYFLSKLGNYFQATEFAARHRDHGIMSIPINPGNLDSDLWRTQGALVHWLLRKVILYPTRYGAYTSLFAAFSPQITAENSGSFVGPWGKFVNATNDMLKGSQSKTQGGTGIAREFWKWNEMEVQRFV